MSADPAAFLGAGYVKMIVKDIRTSIRVGIHPGEREAPQTVIINVEMFAADPGKVPERNLESVVNYDRIRSEIAGWPQRPHVDLLETLLDELADLCFGDARVTACRVSIVKPDIFADAGGAGVELFRIRP